MQGQDATRAGGVTVAEADERRAWGLLSAGDLQGRRIVGRDDETIGTVDDVLIDYDEHAVRYLTVDVGGFLGIGTRTVLVPFESVQWQDDELVLPVEREVIERAPEYRAQDEYDRGYETSIHEAWGLGPYWMSPGYGTDHTHWRARRGDG